MRRLALGALLAVLASTCAYVNCQVATAEPACGGGVSSHGGKEAIHLGARKECNDTVEGKPGGTPEWPKTRVIDCGPPKVVGGIGAVTPKGTNCAFLRAACSVGSAKDQPKDPHLTTTVTLVQQSEGAAWVVSTWNCHAGTARPQLTPWMVRDVLVRLVKPVAIASAPPPPRAVLVNVQWIAWVPTEANRSLGTVTMLGTYRVSLRIHLDHVVWDFGDGARATTDGPGLAYDPARPCHTRLCPEYLGHVYTRDGHFTAKATVTWTGQFSVDGGGWQDVPGDVTVNGPGLPVTIVQARSELVPDGPHN